MSILMLLYGIQTPDADIPEPEPEPEVTAVSGGGPIGGRPRMRQRIDLDVWIRSMRVEEEEYTLTR